jgi:hypothetical protein
MAVERCDSCGRMVDLDTNVEGIIYLNLKPICDSCIDDTYYQEEIDRLEKQLARYRKAVDAFMVIKYSSMKDNKEYEKTVNARIIARQAGEGE